MGLTVPVNVILPQIEGMGGDDKYQVLWLLHGGAGNYADWTRFTGIERYVDRKKLAVVMPDAQDSGYTDMAVGGKTAAYKKYITEELRAYLSYVFPLSTQREDNFVAGLSMGGQGSVRLALNRPDLFSAVGCLSSGNAIDFYGDSGRDPASAVFPTSVRMKKLFGTDNIEKLRDTPADFGYLMKQIKANGQPAPKFFLVCGTEDTLYSLAVALRDKLTEAGFPCTYNEEPGAHTWDFWDRWIQKFIQWLPLRN